MAQGEGLEASTEGRRLRLHEHAELIARYNDLRKRQYNHKESCAELATLYSRSWSGIDYIIRRYQPTTDLAQMILRTNAARLAMRIVRKANVSEAIDILSRKNIGVLAPKTEESGGQTGFFLSVSADSCGAVKVGVQINAPAPIESAAPSEILDIIDTESVTVTLPEPKPTPIKELSHGTRHPEEFQGHIGKAARPESQWSEKTRSALDAARNRIKRQRVLQGRINAKQPQHQKD